MEGGSKLEIEIQPTKPEDLPAIEELIKSGNLSTDLSKCRYVLKACLSDKIVGTVGLEFWGDYVSLRALIVDRRFRKQGIGGALVRRAIKLARKDRALGVYAYTMFWNNKHFRSWNFERKDKDLLPEEIKECAQFHHPHYLHCCAMELSLKQKGVRIISNLASYTFSRRIVFELAIDGELHGANLFYRIEGEAFQYHRQATVDGGTAQEVICLKSGEIPPAAKISYFWQLEDTQGHLKRTREKSFLYLDQRFPWESRTEGKVTLFHYLGAEQGKEEMLLQQITLSLAQIEERLGFALKGPIKVVVYRELYDMRPAFEACWDAPGEVIIAGAAIWRATLILFIRQGWEGTLVHEATHLLTRQLVEKDDSDWLPFWLCDGLADYAAMSRELVRYHLSLFSSLLTHGPTWIGDIGYVEVVRAQSQSLVTFLIEEHGGKEKIHQLLMSLADGTTIDNALLAIYDFDRRGLEEEWLDWLRATRRRKRKEKVLRLLRKLLPASDGVRARLK